VTTSSLSTNENGNRNREADTDTDTVDTAEPRIQQQSMNMKPG